jgi:peptidoglycan/xylan/chitin deacetylase (PgdA/CDA1 family)
MKKIRDKLKKIYFHSRNAYKHTEGRPKRLIVDKAKWLNNADSPVMLMIDDLANAWHRTDETRTLEGGGDWGGRLDGEGAVISFLREQLLRDFPEVKITFFAVAGKISQYTHHQRFTYSEALNVNEEAKRFFKKVYDDDRFEIAYHGLDHGTPGATSEDFVQEWKGFESIDNAFEQISRGKEIFKEVFGEYPKGGKYGGWQYNDLADDSIDRSSFLWWCRDWTPRDTRNQVSDGYYEPQLFGENLVVALPSTIHGFYWSKKQIAKLLEKKQIISIEEHIAPVRPDGRTQTPNIIDDLHELRALFRHLRGKNVWYATGTEIARYIIGHSQSVIYDSSCSGFKVMYHGRVDLPILTVMIDCSAICSPHKPSIEVVLPDQSHLPHNLITLGGKNYGHMVNLPVMSGQYFVSAVEAER